MRLYHPESIFGRVLAASRERQLVKRCAARGIKLAVRGDRIGVIPCLDDVEYENIDGRAYALYPRTREAYEYLKSLGLKEAEPRPAPCGSKVFGAVMIGIGIFVVLSAMCGGA